MISEATGRSGRRAGRAHRVRPPAPVVEQVWCQDGDRAVPLRVEYRPPVTLSRWQRALLAWRYGAGPGRTRGGRFLFALLAPPGWHLWS